jgi:UDP-N-acetylmuramoyl-tripeptide--D-alanyl-D-alanine ligase
VQFRLDEVAEACGGTVIGPAGRLVDGVSIDSRTLQRGQLFVPIVADRDGHEFLAPAAARGAAAYLTSRPVIDPPVTGPLGEVPAVLVADTTRALADLATHARRSLPDRVVAITGSVGKTSVKDLAAAAVRRRFVTTASLRSFNNELGVPLTVLNGPTGAEAAVVEMGARGVGHVAHLCAIVRPTVGVVTRVAPAHLELFGSVEAVARAKGELVEALPAGPLGVAVLNADDERVAAMAGRTEATVLTYGERGEVRADEVCLDDHARARFTVRSPWGSAPVRLGVAGVHMVGNALAAVAAAVSVGVPLDEAAAGVCEAEVSPWRMEVERAPGGFMLLNDAYNASPEAVRAAFDALLAIGSRRSGGAGRGGGGRMVAVVGLMAELGAGSDEAHREIAALARVRGIELVAVGTDAYGPDVPVVPDQAAALATLTGLGPGDAVLVKASRVVGLERLAARLREEGGGGGGS